MISMFSKDMDVQTDFVLDLIFTFSTFSYIRPKQTFRYQIKSIQMGIFVKQDGAELGQPQIKLSFI